MDMVTGEGFGEQLGHAIQTLDNTKIVVQAIHTLNNTQAILILNNTQILVLPSFLVVGVECRRSRLSTKGDPHSQQHQDRGTSSLVSRRDLSLCPSLLAPRSSPLASCPSPPTSHPLTLTQHPLTLPPTSLPPPNLSRLPLEPHTSPLSSSRSMAGWGSAPASASRPSRSVPLGPLGFNSPNIAQRHALP